MKKTFLFLAIICSVLSSSALYSQNHIWWIFENRPLGFEADSDNSGDKRYLFTGKSRDYNTFEIQPSNNDRPYAINTSIYDRFFFQKPAFVFSSNENLILNFSPSFTGSNHASYSNNNMDDGNAIFMSRGGIELRTGNGSYKSWGNMNYRSDTDNTGDGTHNFYGTNGVFLASLDNEGNFKTKSLNLNDSRVLSYTNNNMLTLSAGASKIVESNTSSSTLKLYAGANVLLENSPTQLLLQMNGQSALKAETNKLQLSYPSGPVSQSIFVTNTGVGIGIDAPNAPLHVNGSVKASNFVATTTRFPDYVFARDYNLMPLDAVSEYISSHKHLPNMPSEKEVIANGLDLKEISIISVEKIEELYLHIIELNKQINALETKLNRLQIIDKK